MWHVNKPHRKNWRLQFMAKTSSDIATIAWLKITAPYPPKIPDVHDA
jgi:hypothetical protein